MPELVEALPYGQYTGAAYYDYLDRFQMGVLCRGGGRDRFVGKYVEFAACHVLPIGDCPSYMPREMKDAMVNTGKLWRTETVDEVKRLLNEPVELKQRQDAYTEAAYKHFDLETWAKKVHTEITSM